MFPAPTWCFQVTIYVLDHGTTRSIVTTDPNLGIAALSAVSPSLIYAISFTGYLFKSVDGGINFFFVKKLDYVTAVGSSYSDISFVDANIGYVGLGSRIYKTTDGGNSWTQLVGLTGYNITEIHFIDASHKSKFGKGKRLLVFGAAISNAAKASIRTAIKAVLPTQWNTQKLEWFAKRLNPKIRGWINYYSLFNKEEAHGVFYYLNELIRKWMKNTYKICGRKKLRKKYQLIQAENPLLFYHWKIGIKA